MTYTTTHSTIPQNVPASERKPIAPKMTMAEMAAQEVARTRELFGCQSADWKARRNTTLRQQVMRIIDLLRERPMTTKELASEMGIQVATVTGYLADARAHRYKFEGKKGKEIYLVSEPEDEQVEEIGDVVRPQHMGKAEKAIALLSQHPMTAGEIADYYGVSRGTARDYVSVARKKLGYTITLDTATGLYHLIEGE